VDIAAAPPLADGAHAALLGFSRDLVLDLTDLTFIDAADRSVIVRARRDHPGQFRVILRSPSLFIRKVLGMTKMETICVIESWPTNLALGSQASGPVRTCAVGQREKSRESCRRSVGGTQLRSSPRRPRLVGCCFGPLLLRSPQ
jgi:hypothetical protein